MIVRVPASSANLGPGFDSMGIAWDLYDTIRFERSDILVIDGCDDRFRGKDNLAYRAFEKTLEVCGHRPESVHISFLDTGIPVSRGLGSSAALLAAGAYAADYLFSLGLGKDGSCEIACSMEGHPDNVCPAVFGGFQIASMNGDELFRAEGTVSSRWKFCVLIPEFELSTAEARKALPSGYSRKEAVFNISRTGLLVKALEQGDPELLRYAQDDVIHQPYRYPLISGASGVIDLLDSLGAVSYCISGAGPTILATFMDEIPVGLGESLKETVPGWECSTVAPDPDGLTVS